MYSERVIVTKINLWQGGKRQGEAEGVLNPSHKATINLSAAGSVQVSNAYVNRWTGHGGLYFSKWAVMFLLVREECRSLRTLHSTTV